MLRFQPDIAGDQRKAVDRDQRHMLKAPCGKMRGNAVGRIEQHTALTEQVQHGNEQHREDPQRINAVIPDGLLFTHCAVKRVPTGSPASSRS